MDEPTYSARDIQERNQYLREFLPFMAAYGVVLIAVLSLTDENTTGAAFWHLLPVIPLAGAMWAYYRQLRRADEYSLQLQVKAMSIGFGTMLLASLAFGFLAIANVTPPWSPWLIAGAGFVACFTSLGFMARD